MRMKRNSHCEPAAHPPSHNSVPSDQPQRSLAGFQHLPPGTRVKKGELMESIGDGPGEYRDENGGLYRTATRIRELESKNLISEKILSKGFRHAISPKLCEIIGINPDDMIVFVRNSRDNSVEIEQTIQSMDSSIPIKQRLWIAYRDVTYWHSGRFALPLLKLMKQTYFNDGGEYPDVQESASAPKATSLGTGLPRARPRAAKAAGSKPNRLIERFIADPKSREARDWLRSSSGNTLGELATTDASLALVEQAYAAGAAKVIAVEINEYPEGQNTGKLVLELPGTPAQRAVVFAWAADIAKTQGFDGEVDSGQTHLFVWLD
jgi:hypothetical protein